MSENWLSVRTVAERIDASPATVYRMIYNGRLHPVSIGTGKKRPRVRIAESELNAVMAEARMAPILPRPTPSAPRPVPSQPPTRPRPPAGPAQPPRPAGPRGGDR